ncbi:hypothetical protein C8Q78DRAFT_1022358 [Trametes maxima]|nr:hypothetical protein C8Q78DRAFT_1022358 [Trametes maxima]
MNYRQSPALGRQTCLWCRVPSTSRCRVYRGLTSWTLWSVLRMACLRRYTFFCGSPYNELGWELG